jgi:shikimate dehydrogenase
VPVPPRERLLTVGDVAAWDGRPLVVFLGLRTAGSLAHVVFDRWAAALDQPWTLRGVDLPAATAPETYRALALAMRRNPAVHGAVVTAHKLRLHRACAADLDRRDRLADLTREINALATATTFGGYARDAVSLAPVLDSLIDAACAARLSDLHVLCFGAGGAATALLLALYLDTAAEGLAGLTPGPGAPPGPAPRPDPPAGVTFADVNPQALRDLASVAARAGIDAPGLSFSRLRAPADGDALVAGLPGPALVINATGLGKDAPGSPVTGRAGFGRDTLAWDINYRGDLTFLSQAAAAGAATADGWEYFVAGWAAALSAVAGAAFTAGLLARFTEAAAPARPGRPPGR